ncbi:hypothetical protein ACNF49_39095 [Actinomadura sp. ATCC 39365]
MDRRQPKPTSREQGHLVKEHLAERCSVRRATAYRVLERFLDVHTEVR